MVVKFYIGDAFFPRWNVGMFDYDFRHWEYEFNIFLNFFLSYTISAFYSSVCDTYVGRLFVYL